MLEVLSAIVERVVVAGGIAGVMTEPTPLDVQILNQMCPCDEFVCDEVWRYVLFSIVITGTFRRYIIMIKLPLDGINETHCE